MNAKKIALFAALSVATGLFAEANKYTKSGYVISTWQAIEAPAHFTVSADTIKVVDDETIMNGGAIGSDKAAKGYWPRVADGILSVQMQINDGGWIKYQKIAFKTDGTALYVRAVESGRVESKYGLGCDFDAADIRPNFIASDIPTADNNGSYGTKTLVYTVEGSDYGMVINGSPADYGAPTPAYGAIVASLGEDLSFAAPTGVVTSKPEHCGWTATGWTLTQADGTAESGPDTVTNFVFAEKYNSATMTWNFASSPLPTEAWGKTVGGKVYVYLTKGDTSTTYGNNSCVKGDNWSDLAAPNADNDYIVDLGDSGQLIAHGANAAISFAGRSLLLGNPDTGAQGQLRLYQTKPFSANKVEVANGLVIPDPADWVRYAADTEILPGGTFTIGLKDSKAVYWRSHVSGGEDTVLRFALADGSYDASSATLNIETVSGDSNFYSLTNFYGQLVIEGTNVCYSAPRVSLQATVQPYYYGVSPSFRADAILLRHGGKITTGTAYGYCADFGNRGITVGEGDGGIYWGCGGGTSLDAPLRISIAGTGTFNFTGSATFLKGSFTAKRLNIGASAGLRLDRTFTLGSEAEVEVQEGGKWVGYATPFAPAKTILHAGATFTAGVADGSRYINWGGEWQYSRPDGNGVGTLTLSETSVLDLDAGPLKIGLETASVGGFYGGRFPILKVPTSVRVVTASDFTLASSNGGVDAVEVVTEGEMQTVYAIRTGKVYVVPAGTEGNVPTAPYDTWETAANDLATAVAAADADATVGEIRVAPGTYAPAATVTVGGYEIRSDDGAGNICTDRVIIDGGTTATTLGIRPFVLSSNRSCLRGLTIRNGYTAEAYASGGGGVCITANGASVFDCFITKCCATNAAQTAYGGGLNAGGARAHIERTTFLWNIANQGGGAALQSTSTTSTWPAKEVCCRFVDCAFVSNTAYKVGSAPTGGGIAAINWPLLYLEGTRFCGNALKRPDASGSDNLGSQVQLPNCSHCTVTNCVFEHNGWGCRGLCDGAGAGYARILNCVFRNNRDTSANLVSCGLVENCVFTNNLCQLFYCPNGKTCGVTLRNSLYAYNDGLLNTWNATIENCTIVSNRNYGLYINGTDSSSRPIIVNTVSAYNKAGSVANTRGWANLAFMCLVPRSNVTVSNCCFQGVTTYYNDRMEYEEWSIATLDPTGKSITVDPLCRDPAAGDFRLTRRSPCRDTGLTLDWMSGALDLNGLNRLLDAKGQPSADALPDMGCYECELRRTSGAAVVVR